MTTSTITAEELLTIAAEAAAAGAAVLEERAEVSAVGLPLAAGEIGQQSKSSEADLVTDFDRRAEEAVREVIRGHRPDDAISGEEYGTTSPSNPSGYRWSIDPLDGTTNFIQGIVYYATSVGVIGPEGDWLAGVVHAPALGRRWWAAREGGAFTARLPVRSPQAGTDAAVPEPVRLHGPSGASHSGLLSTGFGYDPARRRRQAETVAELLDGFGNLRRLGSAALDLCMVADGTVEAYAEYGIWEHDWAAGALIVEEAGAPMRRPVHPDSSVLADWTIAGDLGIPHDRLEPTPLTEP
ncbi:inositol monophosphatase family protein [Nesterenkonia aerolata]|uniref:Inositol monophosphatase family protein n=1 Tax=Nesterenkonia aerolata TaxID=3074079 RepID=A0ABU2DTT0_9MICC|nr:inositol monophosphatase family protein [Nesterenkonia sp. LY-0111]MDR8019895.1 inositol monophosphatase family protein [Nesterenkonia sp. LY-0111]